jgi:ATP/maltotriose-dependent transcriptional regulator MalT
VVDDYHEAAGCPEVEQFVAALMDASPVRLLVGTRRRPVWASTRRALYGELTELGASDLAMSAEEVALLLEGRASDAARALADRAEGWPALVSLARRFSIAEDPDARLADHVFRFLAEEVFRADISGGDHLVLAAALLTSVADAAGMRAASTNGRRRLPQLTPRENEVLGLMSDGLGNGEIAKTLFISEKTAKVHISHIFEKLGVATRMQAVVASRRILSGNAGLGLDH